jgi:hypothetical protein
LLSIPAQCSVRDMAKHIREHQLAIRFPRELFRHLEEAALAEGHSITTLIRFILREWMVRRLSDQHEKEAA